MKCIQIIKKMHNFAVEINKTIQDDNKKSTIGNNSGVSKCTFS